MGGVVTFTGVVRASSGGREVVRLEYEAYADMAEKVFREIGKESSEPAGEWVGATQRR